MGVNCVLSLPRRHRQTLRRLLNQRSRTRQLALWTTSCASTRPTGRPSDSAPRLPRRLNGN